MKKTSKLSKTVYNITRYFVRLFYGKNDVIGLGNLPECDAVIVANHTQMNGPIVGQLFMPENCYTWCAGEMMNRKDVPEYAFNDFWSGKPKWTHPFYKLLSHIIAPLADCLFNNARTIAVYHDNRILSTFRETVEMLKSGNNIIIFPEKAENRNNIVNEFQKNFVDIARLYYKRTGKSLVFVPMYIAPRLRKSYIGCGVSYNGENDSADERERICSYLSESITDIARALPVHTVVPYSNLPKSHYLTNKDITEVPS